MSDRVGSRFLGAMQVRAPRKPAWRGPGLPPGTRALTANERAYVHRGVRRGVLLGAFGFPIFGGLTVYTIGLAIRTAIDDGSVLFPLMASPVFIISSFVALYSLLLLIGPYLTRLGISRYQSQAVGHVRGFYMLKSKPVGPALDDVFINVPVEWWGRIPYGPVEFEVFPSPEEAPGQVAGRAVLAVPALGLSVDEDVRAGRISTAGLGFGKPARPPASSA